MEEAPLKVLEKRNAAFHSEESTRAGRCFLPRETDVFVVTYPKCGTTWVTQICNSLRTGGYMDFGEISELCWWDVLAKDCGQDLDADQITSPRIFKSHETFTNIAKTPNERKSCKYILVARNPEDAFISFYHFLPPFVGMKPGDITMEEFADAIFAGVSHSGGIWNFYRDWYTAFQDPDVEVLWIFYEDLKKNLESQVRKIADFMELKNFVKVNDGESLIEVIDKRIATAVRQSEFEFMKEHKEKFDEHFIFGKRKEAMGLEHIEKPSVAKVRANGGVTGGGKKIPAEIAKRLTLRWNEILSPLGFSTYDELQTTIKRKSS